MAEEFVPEGFEIVEEEKAVKTEDGKIEVQEREIIPGFEIVEKEKAVATNAAPAPVGNLKERSMNLNSGNTTSDLPSEEIENDSKKKKKDKKNNEEEKKKEQTKVLETFNIPISEVNTDEELFDYYKYDEDKELIKFNVGEDYSGDDPNIFEEPRVILTDDNQKLNKLFFGRSQIVAPAEGTKAREHWDKKIEQGDKVDFGYGMLSRVNEEEQAAIINGDLILTKINKLDKKYYQDRERGRITSEHYIPGAKWNEEKKLWQVDTPHPVEEGNYYQNVYLNKDGEEVVGEEFIIDKNWTNDDGDLIEDPVASAIAGENLERAYVAIGYKDYSTDPQVAAQAVFNNIQEIAELEKKVEELKKNPNSDPIEIKNLETSIKFKQDAQAALIQKYEVSQGLDEVVLDLTDDRKLNSNTAMEKFSSTLNSQLSPGNVRRFNRKDGGVIAKDLNNAMRGYNIVFQPLDEGWALKSNFTNVAYFINPVMHGPYDREESALGPVWGDDTPLTGLVNIPATFHLNLGNTPVPQALLVSLNEELAKKNTDPENPITYQDVVAELDEGDREEFMFETLKNNGFAGQYDNQGSSMLKKMLDPQAGGHYMPEWMEANNVELNKAVSEFKGEIIRNYEDKYGVEVLPMEEIDAQREQGVEDIEYYKFDPTKHPKSIDGSPTPFYDPFRFNNLSIYSNPKQFNNIKTFTKEMVDNVNEAVKTRQDVGPKIKKLVDKHNNLTESINDNIKSFNKEYELGVATLDDIKKELDANAVKFKETYEYYEKEVKNFESKVNDLTKEYQGLLNNTNDPDLSKQIIEEFEQKQDALRKEFKPIERNYNDEAGELQDRDEQLVSEYNDMGEYLKNMKNEDETVRIDQELRAERELVNMDLQKLQPQQEKVDINWSNPYDEDNIRGYTGTWA